MLTIATVDWIMLEVWNLNLNYYHRLSYRNRSIRRHSRLVAALKLLPHLWMCWTKKSLLSNCCRTFRWRCCWILAVANIRLLCAREQPLCSYSLRIVESIVKIVQQSSRMSSFSSNSSAKGSDSSSLVSVAVASVHGSVSLDCLPGICSQWISSSSVPSLVSKRRSQIVAALK